MASECDAASTHTNRCWRRGRQRNRAVAGRHIVPFCANLIDNELALSSCAVPVGIFSFTSPPPQKKKNRTVLANGSLLGPLTTAYTIAICVLSTIYYLLDVQPQMFWLCLLVFIMF